MDIILLGIWFFVGVTSFILWAFPNEKPTWFNYWVVWSALMIELVKNIISKTG